MPRVTLNPSHITTRAQRQAWIDEQEFNAKVGCTYDERVSWCSAHITLNNKPARISGACLKFPVIQTLDGLTSVEFSWHAIRRVIETRSGKFKA